MGRGATAWGERCCPSPPRLLADAIADATLHALPTLLLVLLPLLQLLLLPLLPAHSLERVQRALARAS